jgi:hypothetical protein
VTAGFGRFRRCDVLLPVSSRRLSRLEASGDRAGRQPFAVTQFDEQRDRVWHPKGENWGCAEVGLARLAARVSGFGVVAAVLGGRCALAVAHAAEHPCALLPDVLPAAGAACCGILPVFPATLARVPADSCPQRRFVGHSGDDGTERAFGAAAGLVKARARVSSARARVPGS